MITDQLHIKVCEKLFVGKNNNTKKNIFKNSTARSACVIINKKCTTNYLKGVIIHSGILLNLNNLVFWF